MKQFLQKNGVQIFILIVAVGVAWGVTQTGVSHNTDEIMETKEDVTVLQTESVTSQVQYGRIETRLDNIEGLLIQIRDK